MKVYRDQSPGSGKLRNRSYSRSQSRDNISKQLEDISDKITKREESNIQLIELMKSLGEIGTKSVEEPVENPSHFVEVISKPIEIIKEEGQITGVSQIMKKCSNELATAGLDCKLR